MAKVGTAYVEIKPDMSGFARELKARLAEVNAEVKVQVVPDTRGFAQELRARLFGIGAKVRIPVEPDTTTFASKLRAQLRALSMPGVGVPLNVDISRIVEEIRRAIRIGTQIATAESKARPIKVSTRVDNDNILRLGRRAGTNFAGAFFTTSGRVFSMRMGRAFGAVEKIAQKAFRFLTTTGAEAANAVASFISRAFFQAGEAVAGFSQIAGTVLQKFGKGAAESLVSVVSMIQEFAGPIGTIISLVIALTAAMMAMVTIPAILSAIYLAFGALEFVIITIVAAVYALIGAVLELVGVIGGLLGLLPALGLTGIAAFGTLAIGFKAFSDMFQDETSVLAKSWEKFSTSIGKKFTKGLDTALSKFFTTFETGFGKVAESWNKVLGGLLGFFQTNMGGVNVVLGMAAEMVEKIGAALGPVLNGFLTMTLAAKGPFSTLLDTFVKIAKVFDEWATAMSRSGKMQRFFEKLSDTLSEMAALFEPLAGILGGLFDASLGPAKELFGILNDMMTPWSEWINSEEGQTTMENFFSNINQIVKAFGPVLESVAKTFVELAPIIKDIFVTISPHIPAFLNLFLVMAKAMAPGLIVFAQEFGKLLATPGFQKSMEDLAKNVGVLIENLAKLDPDLIIIFVVNVMLLVIWLGKLVAKFNEMIAFFKQWASDIEQRSEEVGKNVREAFNKVIRAIEEFPGKVREAGVRMVRSLADGLGNIPGVVSGQFGRVPAVIIGTLSGLPGQLFQSGRNIIQGLINGLASMLNPLSTTMSSLIKQGITNWLPNSPQAKIGPLSGQGQPFKRGATVGSELAEGLASTFPSLSNYLNVPRVGAAGVGMPGALSDNLNINLYAMLDGHLLDQAVDQIVVGHDEDTARAVLAGRTAG